VLKREGWNWVWVVLLAADVVWEVSAAIRGGRPFSHLTLSQIVKRWEGIDPVTGKPLDTPVGLIKRVCVALALVAAAVLLVLHWAVQVI
jgi:hypothetical protein